MVTSLKAGARTVVFTALVLSAWLMLEEHLMKE